MKRLRIRPRDIWLAVMVAGFLLMIVSLALQWWPGAWVALGIGLAFSVAFWRLHSDAESERIRWHRTLDAMQTAIVLWDRDDRLVFANADFKRLYGLAEAEARVGTPFESLLRKRVQAGAIAEALGREEAWIAERVAERRQHDGGTLLRRMDDGGWRRISEQPLANGNLLAYSIDISELVEHERALEAARAEAETAHRLLRDAIEAIPAGIEVYDEQDRLVLFNRRLAAMYPHVAEQMSLGQTFGALVRRSIELGMVKEALGREDAWLADRLAQRVAARGDTPLLQQIHDGRWMHIYETRGVGGSIVGVRLDVTDLVRQREELAAAHARAEAAHGLLLDAIEAMPDGFALFDADDRLVVCNQRYREIYPASAPAMVPGASFESIVRRGLERGQYPEAQADPEAWLAERLRRHRETDGKPILQQLTGGRWLQIDERRTRSGGIAGARADVTELMLARQAAEASRAEAQRAVAALRDANAALETLSTTDALTGIANRRRFEQRLQEELQRVKRYEAPLALLLADVDYFKRYNDRHGHPQGDRALQQIAALLAQQARRPGELAARFGGEEFVVLLPHADGTAALALAERCREAVARLALPHGNSPAAPHVTVSIGVAEQAPGEAAASLIKRADMALYAAKAAGRNRAELDAHAAEAG